MSRTPLALAFIAFGLAVLLLVSFRSPTPQTRPQRQVNPQKTSPLESIGTRLKMESMRVQDTDFHRTIIDNNLFRPLEWRPPRPKEPYRLLGTILPTHGDPQAILQATTQNKIHTVTSGDKLNTDTTGTDIQAKQVTLERTGQQRTLKSNPSPWLK